MRAEFKILITVLKVGDCLLVDHVPSVRLFLFRDKIENIVVVQYHTEPAA